MRKSTLLIMAILFMAGNLFAQVDTIVKPKDSLTVKYLLSSDFTFTTGNVESFNTVNKGQLELERRVIGWKLLAGYRYGLVDSTVNANELTVATFINFFPQNRVYGFINGGFEFSFLRGVQYRGYGGAGAGFRVVKDDVNEFEPYINILYEYTKFQDPIVINGDTTDIRQTARGVIGWTGLHKVFKKRLVITHNAKYQQSLQTLNDFRFDASVTLALPVFKILSVKTGAGFTYENIVIEGRKRGDFVFTFGILLTNI